MTTPAPIRSYREPFYISRSDGVVSVEEATLYDGGMRNQRIPLPYQHVETAQRMFPICVIEATVESVIEKLPDCQPFVSCQVTRVDVAYVKHSHSVAHEA
jgi:hypothetical protein